MDGLNDSNEDLTQDLGGCVGHNARRTIEGVAREGGEQSLSTAGLEAAGSEAKSERRDGRPATPRTARKSARVSLPDVAECDNSGLLYL